MYSGRTFLPGPRHTTIGRGHNEAVSSDRPAARGTIRGESDRIEMVFRRRGDLRPLLTAVFRHHDRAARADHKSMLTILNIQRIESRGQTCVLALPLKTTIDAVENHTVGAH